LKKEDILNPIPCDQPCDIEKEEMENDDKNYVKPKEYPKCELVAKCDKVGSLVLGTVAP